MCGTRHQPRQGWLTGNHAQEQTYQHRKENTNLFHPVILLHLMISVQILQKIDLIQMNPLMILQKMTYLKFSSFLLPVLPIPYGRR